MEELEFLLARQNPDGGWGYRGGGSATEPTAYSLMAIRAAGSADPRVIAAGRDWLRRSRNADGGWPPRPGVAQSTWVTALVLLAGQELLEGRELLRCVAWLLDQSGRESGWVDRLRIWMLGLKREVDPSQAGWPWFPGAAAWVSPTALTILALDSCRAAQLPPRVAERCHEGREYLLARICSDGGWNHGSTRALGYEAQSYPETTALALLALRGHPFPGLARSLDLASRQYVAASGYETAAWLKLALLAHGRTPPARSPHAGGARTVPEAAIGLIASRASSTQSYFFGEAR